MMLYLISKLLLITNLHALFLILLHTLIYGNLVEEESVLKTYVVQKGDTLWLIARRYGISLDSLIAANSQISDPDRIEVGWVINIPVGGQPIPTMPPCGPMNYTVMAGDTLWLISKKFGIALEDLIKANPQIPDPNRIDIGQIIVIPAKVICPPTMPQVPTMPPMHPMPSMPHMPSMPPMMPCDVVIHHMHHICGCCSPEQMMPMHQMKPMHMPMMPMHSMESMHGDMGCMPHMMHMHMKPCKPKMYEEEDDCKKKHYKDKDKEKEKEKCHHKD